MKVLPSTSVTVAPCPSAMTTGRKMESGSATTFSLRSRISFERGPGMSVRMSIVRVTAIGVTISNVTEAQPFLERDLADDPFTQFAAWFDEAAAVVDAPEI